MQVSGTHTNMVLVPHYETNLNCPVFGPFSSGNHPFLTSERTRYLGDSTGWCSAVWLHLVFIPFQTWNSNNSIRFYRDPEFSVESFFSSSFPLHNKSRKERAENGPDAGSSNTHKWQLTRQPQGHTAPRTSRWLMLNINSGTKKEALRVPLKLLNQSVWT